MHDLRFAPRTLLAVLACTLAIGLAACSGGDGATSPPSGEGRGASDVGDEVVGVFSDPAVPVEGIAPDDVFVLALERSPAEDVRWSLSPRPDIAYVLARGGGVDPDGPDPQVQRFEFLALGPGTFQLSFKEVQGMFGRAVADGRTATFTVTIDDPDGSAS